MGVGYPGRPSSLPGPGLTVPSRIKSRSLTARHGKARNIKIAGSLGNDGIWLSVADDGCGFDPAARPGPAEGHFGLQGAKERLAAIGGTMHIESSPGNGTKVTVEIGK